MINKGDFLAFNKESLLDICVNIIYENSDIFFISKSIIFFAKNLQFKDEDDKINYIKFKLKHSIGLNFMISEIVDNYNNYYQVSGVYKNDDTLISFNKTICLLILRKYLILNGDFHLLEKLVNSY
jgi:hypothetical protein